MSVLDDGGAEGPSLDAHVKPPEGGDPWASVHRQVKGPKFVQRRLQRVLAATGPVLVRHEAVHKPCSLHGVGHSPTDCDAAQHPAERLAATISNPDNNDILRLLKLLPSEKPARGVEQPNSHSFSTGAFSKDGRVGVRNFLKEFPVTSRLLTAFVRRHAPGHCFGAVALFTNLEADFHKDVNNDASCHNWICPLSHWEAGGEVWVEDEQGSSWQNARGVWRRGRLLPVRQHPVLLASHDLHKVLPWKGNRVVLVAFMPRGLSGLEPEHQRLMSSAGFVLPGIGHALPPFVREGGALQDALVSPGARPDPRVPPPPSVGAGVGFPGLRCKPESHPTLGHCARPSDGFGLPTPLSTVTRSPNAAQDAKPPYVLEIFCGTAGVAAAMQARGCDVLGIDKDLRPRKVRAPAVRLDLCDAEQRRLVWQEIQRADAVWLAPPCGTSSRARGIRLPSGGPQPKALRSEDFPQGFPSLRGVNKARVTAANTLYAFCAEVFEYCRQNHKVAVIENPERSFMWLTVWMQRVLSMGRWHVLHACMYGSRRLKRTALLATHDLPSMRSQCDGAHAHMAWGRCKQGAGWAFATAAEVSYPRPMCSAAANDLCAILRAKGSLLDGSYASRTALATVASQRQPRRDGPQVGPEEFLSTVTVQVPAEVEVPDCIPATGCLVPGLGGVPAGSKLLASRRCEEGGKVVREVVFGIYRTPDAFVNEALKCTHPFDKPGALDMDNVQAMANIFQHGIEGTKAFRERMLDHYRNRARELQPMEDAAKGQMHPDVKAIMGSKRLLLLQELMSDAGVQDRELVADMASGFRLTGELRPSGLFPRQLKLTQDDLKATCRWSKHLVEASCRRAARDKEVAAKIWDETLEQKEKQWVKGPFSWSEINDKYKGEWIASKRFGVVQGEKIRGIDDLSEFLVNASVTETEKVVLDGVDAIAATARFFVRGALGATEEFHLPDRDGETFSGRLHPDFRDKENRQLHGRALDLKSAYKQLARHPDDAWATILAVLNPSDDTVYYFEAVALPFGGTGSVTSFNRAARVLKMVMARLFWLVSTNYYDDYCQMELSPLIESASQTAEALLELLGWEVARGDKLKDFAKSFDILGVTVRFDRACEGIVEVCNKAGRIEELTSALQNLASGACGHSELASFKGRMLFATNHVYGRCAQICTQLISQAQRSGDVAVAREAILDAARLALDTLRASGPRRLSCWAHEPPVLIFSDGAHEDQIVTHGAVLFDPLTGRQEFFGDFVPEWLVKRWRSKGLKQLIFFAELLPVAVAKATWAHVLEGRLCFFFVDNEAARASLIRSFTPVINATSILMDVALADVKSNAISWYSRVPSKSNIADDASRLCFTRYQSMFRQVAPVYESIT